MSVKDASSLCLNMDCKIINIHQEERLWKKKKGVLLAIAYLEEEGFKTE